MTLNDLVQYLKTEIPDLAGVIKSGSIDKNKTTSVGVYKRGTVAPNIAIGGKQNSTYNTMPVTILVHWTENTLTCETKAQEIYDTLFGLADVTMNGVKVYSVDVLDPSPVDMKRDEKNIVEMVIRLNIIHERS